MNLRTYLSLAAIALMLTACGSDKSNGSAAQVFAATLPADQQNAPVFTVTPTSTATFTLTPTVTPSPTNTPTLTATLTVTPSSTPTLTQTPSPTPTTPLLTLTPASADGAPEAFVNPTADFTTPEGWACGDFPCEDDVEAFLQRIRVPAGYTVEHVGRFPGQPMQITYGPDGRLYATLLEAGTRSGAVYVMNADGSSQRYSGTLISPIGLAFQPGTDDLYVSSRLELNSGGALWKIESDGEQHLILDNLPCCFQSVDNQPNGMTFGPDGYLYLGVGALTDHGEPQNPLVQAIADFHPLEASILRIQPHTGEVLVYAQGIRNPYDLTFNSSGQLFVTDNGTLAGPGDRLLRVQEAGHYGWPFWRARGCAECPLTNRALNAQPDLLLLPDYTLPRGIVAYTGTQFPANIFDSLFVALWNGTPNAQRIVRVVPAEIPTDKELAAAFEPEPFVTGLIRPVDVILDPEGALVIADYIYGHIWRVRYVGPDHFTPIAERTYVPDESNQPEVTVEVEPLPSATPLAAETAEPGGLFVTSTPRP